MLSEREIAQWKSLAPALQTLDLRDKARIYAQGDQLTSLFWLLSGIVKLSHFTEGGAQLTTAVLGPGAVFGSALDKVASEHAATSLGDTRVVRIAHRDLTNLVGNSPEFTAFLLAALGAWHARTERRLVTLLTKPVETRLIETLRELAATFGTPCPHGYAIEIRLTQQDIADLVYASRPVVTKTMNALRRRGVLDYRRELICVNDAALQSIS